MSDHRVFRDDWFLYAPALFLFVLPIARTTPLRFVLMALTLASAVVVWLRLADLRPRPLSRTLSVALVSWVLVALLTCFTSREPSYSWGEFRNEILYTLAVFATFVVLTSTVEIGRRWRTALVLSAIFIGVASITMFLVNDDWLRTGMVGDRNAYSTYVVLIFPLLLFAWTEPSGRFDRVVIAVAIVLALVSGAMTLNRNMWFALALESVAFVTLLHVAPKRDTGRPSRPLRLVAMVVAMVAFFVCVFAWIDGEKGAGPPGLDRMKTTFLQDPRLEIWRYAFLRVGEAPWLGHGFGRGILRSDFVKHFDNPLKWHGHNMLLNYALEAGMLGLATIVAVLAALVSQCASQWRSADEPTRRLGILGLTFLAGTIVKMMTDDILVRENALLFWSMLGMIVGVASRRSVGAA